MWILLYQWNIIVNDIVNDIYIMSYIDEIQYSVKYVKCEYKSNIQIMQYGESRIKISLAMFLSANLYCQTLFFYFLIVMYNFVKFQKKLKLLQYESFLDS